MFLWYHNTTPVLVPNDLVQACMLSQPSHCRFKHYTPEKFDYRYYCITMKVSRDYRQFDTAQKNTISVWKKANWSKTSGFYFFPIVNRGGLTPETLPCVRHCSPPICLNIFVWDRLFNIDIYQNEASRKHKRRWNCFETCSNKHWATVWLTVQKHAESCSSLKSKLSFQSL